MFSAFRHGGCSATQRWTLATVTSIQAYRNNPCRGTTSSSSPPQVGPNDFGVMHIPSAVRLAISICTNRYKLEKYTWWAMLLEILLAVMNCIYAIAPCSIEEQDTSRTFGDMGRMLQDIFVTMVLYRPSALFDEKSENFSVRG